MKITQVDNPALEVHDLTVSYDRKPVLWSVDFSLPKGSLVGIMGPNGSGKSTLLKSIMGLVPTSSGYVKIFGQDLKNIRKRISYVPQRESVDWDFPASVADVVLMGRYGHLGLFRRPGKADREIAEECLVKVGMENFRNRQISQLSGGQQQRVFLARALAQQAELYFMDEPFVGVDAATERTIMDLLREMRDEGKTVIVVHHNIQNAGDYFDWLVLMNLRLVASGPTEDVFNTEYIQEAYGGKLTLLNSVVEQMRNERHSSREKI